MIEKMKFLSITGPKDDIDRVVEQYDFRRRLVLDCLMRHDFDVRDLNAIVSRGGLLVPIHAGAYEINEDMV